METSGSIDDDFIGYVETMLQRYLPAVDVSKLSDKDFARKYNQLQDILKRENKNSQ